MVVLLRSVGSWKLDRRRLNMENTVDWRAWEQQEEVSSTPNLLRKCRYQPVAVPHLDLKNTG